MVPIITVKTDQVGCRKPRCHHRLTPTHRHHRRCETLFIRAWPNRYGFKPDKKYQDLCKRYESFDPRDIAIVCAWHHAEIHFIYNDIIAMDVLETGRILRDYTQMQATALMRRLRKACYEWEKEETPGVNPAEVFTNTPKRGHDGKRGKKKGRPKKRGRKKG